MTKEKRLNFGVFLLLQFSLLLYSFYSVCSKFASNYDYLSIQFIGIYGIALFLLGVYALLWQQILKRMTLTAAFSNKAVTIIWGMIWGVLFFSETINYVMIIGAAIVFAGVYCVVSEYE